MAKAYEFMFYEVSDEGLLDEGPDAGLERFLSDDYGSEGWDIRGAVTLASGNHVLVLSREIDAES